MASALAVGLTVSVTAVAAPRVPRLRVPRVRVPGQPARVTPVVLRLTGLLPGLSDTPMGHRGPR